MLLQGDRATAMGSSLLSGLPVDARDALLDAAGLRAFDRGTTVFLQGEPASLIYVVLEGWVKLYRISPNGAEVVVNCFTSGQSFAEAAALLGGAYPVNAEAVTDCRLATVPGNVLTNLMLERPEISVSILATMYAHFHDLVGQIESLKARSGAQRVAAFLLHLCPRQSGPAAVTLPYDKSLIAGRLGMKPESLSRAFARLHELGVAVRQNQATIADVERLRTYVEADPAGAWNGAR